MSFFDLLPRGIARGAFFFLLPFSHLPTICYSPGSALVRALVSPFGDSPGHRLTPLTPRP